MYQQPIETVWPQVVSFVSDEGYAHRKGKEEFALVTDHTPLTRGPAQLNRTTGRDGPLEWRLLQYVDAERAKALEAQVIARQPQK